MILVLGATGTIGRRVAAQLEAGGHAMRVASRHTPTPFDWTDDSTWRPALEAVGGLFLMAPDGQDVDPELVGQAVRSGVRRIVLLSSGGIEVMGDQRLLAAERTVRESGAQWTIVRPSWFDQNFDEGFLREGVLAGRITVPVGELRQPFVDAGDIAAVVVAALTRDGHVGESYEVTGPRALSFGDAATIIGRAARREVRFDGSPEGYLAAMTGAGMPEEQAKAAIEAFAALRDQGDAQPTDVVRRVTGRAPKPFETYVSEAAERGAWAG
ncbi:SDR family oxidoreductase [Nonomuraea sp. NPDC050663]|uniref:SDR family oxidoreductase n=1 Tax=Nonomuraea sp. NPDC050663 TaxID=3364370 RepID=UPI0037A7E4BD